MLEIARKSETSTSLGQLFLRVLLMLLFGLQRAFYRAFWCLFTVLCFSVAKSSAQGYAGAKGDGWVGERLWSIDFGYKFRNNKVEGGIIFLNNTIRYPTIERPFLDQGNLVPSGETNYRTPYFRDDPGLHQEITSLYSGVGIRLGYGFRDFNIHISRCEVIGSIAVELGYLSVSDDYEIRSEIQGANPTDTTYTGEFEYSIVAAGVFQELSTLIGRRLDLFLRVGLRFYYPVYIEEVDIGYNSVMQYTGNEFQIGAGVRYFFRDL